MPHRLEALCEEKRLRMTDQRRVIARVLSDAGDHPDAEELHRRAAAVDPRISLATVYRTMRLFEDAGIIERHDFRDGRARYEESPSEHHDHLINVKTGEVIEPIHLPFEKIAASWPDREKRRPLSSEEEAHRARIMAALEQCAGNQTRAAEMLGVARQTLSKWLTRYDFPRPRKG